jgi:hypothetical protein
MRTESIEFKLTKAEKSAIQTAAGREPVASYVRRRLLTQVEQDGPGTPTGTPSTSPQIPAEAVRRKTVAQGVPKIAARRPR